MNKADLQRYQQELETLKSRLRSVATAVADQTREASGGQAVGQLSNAPLHLGDNGTEEFLHEMNATLTENEEYLANEARAALRRIDEGTYGICENCGQPIGAERLEAIPYVRLCISCAVKDDPAPNVNLNHGRPLGPDDTLAPEGDMGDERGPGDVPADEDAPPPAVDEDVHAAGAAGGGTAVGGLAGSNIGHGDPNVANVEDAFGSGNFDLTEDRVDKDTPLSGRSGGAVGGTPARKRST